MNFVVLEQKSSLHFSEERAWREIYFAGSFPPPFLIRKDVYKYFWRTEEADGGVLLKWNRSLFT